MIVDNVMIVVFFAISRTAVIVNSPCEPVASCFAVIIVEPALCIVTVRPPAPPILATVVSLLVKINGSQL